MSVASMRVRDLLRPPEGGDNLSGDIQPWMTCYSLMLHARSAFLVLESVSMLIFRSSIHYCLAA